MNVEITLKRGEVAVLGWDDDFARRFEEHMDAHPEDANPSDPKGFYRTFMANQRGLIRCFEKVLGDDAEEPFTITIKVENKRYHAGPLY